MQDFRITLDSKTNVFWANSEVSGTVYLKTDEAIKSRKIDIKINGRAKTGFHHQVWLASTRTYIDQEIILWTADSGKIGPGEFEFPFKFTIPVNAPPNISGLYGNIKYFVDARIDVPMGFNKKATVGFSVIPYIDLNSDSKFGTPIVNSIKKSGMFSSKGVNVTLQMPKMGYVCGEAIPLTITIDNESSSDVKSVETGIEATYDWNAGDNMSMSKSHPYVVPRKTDKKYCFEDTPLQVAAGQSSVFNRTITIPPCPPSFDWCDIMKLKYHVCVKVHTTAVLSRGASASMPIVIGTIPTRSRTDSAEPKVIDSETFMQPPQPSAFSSSADAFESINFVEEESQEKSEIKDDEDDVGDFQPKFAYYSDTTKFFNPRN